MSRSDRLANRSGVKTEDIVKTSVSPISKTPKSKPEVVKEEKTASRTSTRKVQFQGEDINNQPSKRMKVDHDEQVN